MVSSSVTKILGMFASVISWTWVSACRMLMLTPVISAAASAGPATTSAAYMPRRNTSMTSPSFIGRPGQMFMWMMSL